MLLGVLHIDRNSRILIISVFDEIILNIKSVHVKFHSGELILELFTVIVWWHENLVLHTQCNTFFVRYTFHYIDVNTAK